MMQAKTKTILTILFWVFIALMAFILWTMTLCVLVAVVVSILAIWEFTGTGARWRTVATCGVIAAGTLAFSWINGLFDPGERDS